MHEAGIMEVNGSPSISNKPLAMWDDVMNEPVPAGPNPLPDSLPDIPAELDQPQIEDQNIPLSSNGNIGPHQEILKIHIRHYEPPKCIVDGRLRYELVTIL